MKTDAARGLEQAAGADSLWSLRGWALECRASAGRMQSECASAQRMTANAELMETECGASVERVQSECRANVAGMQSGCRGEEVM